MFLNEFIAVVPFKKILFLFLQSLLISVFFGSCAGSIMKRHYRKGFYIASKNVSPLPILSSKNTSDQTVTQNNGTNIHTPCSKSQNDHSFVSKPKADTAVNQSENLNAAKTAKRKLTKHSSLTCLFENATILPLPMNHFCAKKQDPENSLVQKPLSMFWIILVLVLILYLAVIIFAAESLLPLGHIIGLIFAGLLLLWLLRVF